MEVDFAAILKYHVEEMETRLMEDLKIEYERNLLSLPWETGHLIGLYVEALERQVQELKSARLSYAYEFDCDVGDIHENIRGMKARMAKLEAVITDMLVIAKLDGWDKASTGCQFIYRDAVEVLGGDESS